MTDARIRTPRKPTKHPLWFQPAVHLAGRLAGAWPSAGIGLAKTLGRLIGRFSLLGPSPEQVRQLFGDLPDAQLRDIAARMGALTYMNGVVREMFGTGELARKRLETLVRVDGADRLRALHENRTPAVLVAWHLGPLPGIVIALRMLQVPALWVLWVKPRFKVAAGEAMTLVGSANPEARALTLKRCVDRLRAGGLVLMMFEGPGSKTCELPCLGRHTRFSRGPVVLARITGAPLVPVTAKWESDGSAIRVTVHEPLRLPDCPRGAGIAFEDQLAATAAAWLDTYLRREPQELKPRRLFKFLEKPPVPSPQPDLHRLSPQEVL